MAMMSPVPAPLTHLRTRGGTQTRNIPQLLRTANSHEPLDEVTGSLEANKSRLYLNSFSTLGVKKKKSTALFTQALTNKRALPIGQG